jgi:protoporphyrinogen oxidase
MKVAVLGGGLAGLSAAYHLNKHGIEPVLVEREREVGGIARSLEFDGFTLDFGPHRFHTEKGWILDLAKELLGDELIVRERISRIMFRDRYIEYPLRPDAILSLKKPEIARVMIDYVKAKIRKRVPGEEESFAEWVTGRFGRSLYEFYFREYNKKIWGIDPSELSASWGTQRVDSLTLTSILKKMMSIGKDPRTFVSRYYYPRRGIGTLSSAMADRIKGRIITGSPVSGVSRKGGSWIVSHGRGEVRADRIISTIPVRDLFGMLGFSVPTEIRKEAEALEYRNSIFIFLSVERESVTKDSWIYYHSPGLLVSRISQQKNFSPRCCPEGRTALTCEIFTGDGEEVWSWPDERIIERIKDEVVEVGLLEDRNLMTRGKVVRMAKTYPLWRLGTEKRMGRVMGFLDGMGVLSTGRQGLFYHTNMDHSIDMGRKAAEELISDG